MGSCNCCGARPGKGVSVGGSLLGQSKQKSSNKDLPEPSLQGIKDLYRLFELKLPFARTPLQIFLENV